MLQQFTASNLKNLVFVAACGEHSSLFTVEDHPTSASPFFKVVATPPLPGHRRVIGKFQGYRLGVGGFPIVLIGIPPSRGYHLYRVVHLQPPAHEVYFMRAVIQCFTGTPVPEPMPVVVRESVLIHPSGSRSLPQFKVMIRRHINRFAFTYWLPVVGIPASGELYFAYYTFMQSLHALRNYRK